jgi:addiction module HigA family antidote
MADSVPSDREFSSVTRPWRLHSRTPSLLRSKRLRRSPGRRGSPGSLPEWWLAAGRGRLSPKGAAWASNRERIAPIDSSARRGSLGLTVKRAAEILGVTRQALNNIVNEKAAISADMAIRLEKAFGGTANAWLQMQNNYDLARAAVTRIN